MSNPIGIGTKVEDFQLLDQDGSPFKLSDHRGKKVLLSFHPLAWTPVCAQQMKDLEKHYEEFQELNTLPVGVSVDSTFSKKAWAESLGIERLRMLADFWPHGELARKLGIFREEDGFSERANVILDEEGKVIFIKVYPIREVPDLKEILDFLKENSK